MKLEELKQKPDNISVEECKSYFEKKLLEFLKKNISKKEFLEILIELTDRQVRTYEILDNDIRNKIDDCLSLLWNTDSYDDVDSILSITVNLGLVKTYEKVKETLNSNKEIKDEILMEIKDCVDENGDDISDPYRFLKNN